MSFGPIARCNGSLGRSCLTRSRRRFAASCRRTTTWRTSTTSRWRTSIDSSLRGTNSGRATCTTILRGLMIRKSLFRRVARRSLRGEGIVGRGSALIFRRPILWFQTFLLNDGCTTVGGSKFPEIDVFGDVYVRPGNELAESLHTTMVERSQLVLQESASQLPPDTPIECVDPPQDAGFQILTETLDQTLGRRPGTYCRGMGNARHPYPVHQRSQTVRWLL
ncbi:unnamed protein product [Prunus armeniaca]